MYEYITIYLLYCWNLSVCVLVLTFFLRYNQYTKKCTLLNMQFSLFSQCCTATTTTTILILEKCLYTQKKLHTCWQLLSTPWQPSPRQPLICLVPHRSACSDISYKWNRTVCGIFYLASFTYYSIFKVHPCYSMYQYFLFIVK